MREEELRRGDPIRPLDWHETLPFEADASSDRLGWVGLEAARYREPPASEINLSPLTHHRLILFARPPEELDLRYEGLKRHDRNATGYNGYGEPGKLRSVLGTWADEAARETRCCGGTATPAHAEKGTPPQQEN
jgi:hypothetical protein